MRSETSAIHTQDLTYGHLYIYIIKPQQTRVDLWV